MGNETFDAGTPKGWFVQPVTAADGSLIFRVILVIRPSISYQGYTDGQEVPDKEIRVPAHLPWWMFWEPDFETRAAEAFDHAKKRAWELNEAIAKSKRLCYQYTNPATEKPNAAESE